MVRAGETGIRHTAVRFVGKPTGALQVAVGRWKTSTSQYIHAFCDAESWESDIFHALGSHLATSGNTDDEYHFKSASARTINNILTRVCGQSDKFSVRFQSHSGRRGCASDAPSSSGVSVTEVIARGGWALDTISRVFLYFSGVDRGDMRVGRAVAGWAWSDKGAVPPSVDAVSTADRALFDTFTLDLFRRCLAYHDKSLLSVLSCSLVMYYNSVKAPWDAQAYNVLCVLLMVMQQSVQGVEGSVAHFCSRSINLLEQWTVSNLPWLRWDTVQHIPEDARARVTLDMFSFQEAIERQLLSQQTNVVLIAKVQLKLDDQMAKLDHLTRTAERVANTVDRLGSLLGPIHQSPILPHPHPSLTTLQPASKLPVAPSSTSQLLSVPTTLKGIRSSTLFVDYMANGWYKVASALHGKETVRKMKLVASRVRDFIPAACLLTSWFSATELGHCSMASKSAGKRQECRTKHD